MKTLTGQKHCELFDSFVPLCHQKTVPGVMMLGQRVDRKEVWEEVWILEKADRGDSEGDEPCVSGHHFRKSKQVKRMTRGRQLKDNVCRPLQMPIRLTPGRVGERNGE